MKNIFCFLILLFPVLLFSQNENLKHDYIWLTGYASNPDQLEFGGTVIDFNETPVETYYEFRDMDFDIASVSMCDAGGEIIFSSNNSYVANRLNEPMANGEGLNPEPAFQDRVRQAMLALPNPARDSTYYILHNETKWVGDLDGTFVAVVRLYKTVVDMKWSANPLISDLGQVVEKNVVLVEDTLNYGKLTATRHANGRDWWVLQQQYGTNKFYRFLINPEGIIELEPQLVGDFPLHGAHGVGQAVFSPDGTHYLVSNLWRTDMNSHLDFYNFDRCTGLLSNFERKILNPPGGSYGLAISPNSKYAYFIYERDYYQIDLDQTPKELTLIQEYDGVPSSPYLGQLAPDGKIYFSANTTLPEMHVITNPNEGGENCNVEQHGQNLATLNRRTIPNHPNYRLGRLLGSPCDTLIWVEDTTSLVVSPVLTEELQISVSPNPASQEMTVSFDSLMDFSDYDIALYSSIGVKIMSVDFREATATKLDISTLPVGVYWLKAENDKNDRKTIKVMIVR